MSVAQALVAAWYAPRLTWRTAPLLPLTAVYALATALRRGLYNAGLLRTQRVRVPVVIIGNLTVGGGGKTPMVRALAHALAVHGHKPGIISRGYGGNTSAPRAVSAADSATIVGDEPLVLATAGFPVFIGHDRVAAAQALLAAHPQCTVLVSDDGLQHYALGRDVEVVVLDAARAFGNGWLLPAGPLRESTRRLATVDAIVRLVPYDAPFPPARHDGRETAMAQVPLALRNVRDPTLTASAERFRGPGVHALAGIANPARFFASLTALGIDAITHPFPDHHAFKPGELEFPGAQAVLMTEKDAVKCRQFADARCWYLPIEARLDPAFVGRVVKLIGER